MSGLNENVDEQMTPINDLSVDIKPTRDGKRSGLQWIANQFKFENDIHRKNFVKTMCVYYNFILLGWTYGLLGTAFPDIQLILNTNVQQTSLIFTMNSVGYMVGSLVVGSVYDRVRHLKLLGILSLLSGVTSCVLPWCNVFVLFMCLRLLDGFLCGGRDGGGNAKVASSWGTAGRKYMQGLHFTYALGGIVSPIVTSFFLAPKIHVQHDLLTNTTNNESFIINYSSKGVQAIANSSSKSYKGASTNVSDLLQFTDIFSSNNLENSTLDTSINTDLGKVIYGETKVHIAFVLTGILTALSGIAYILLDRKGYDEIPPYTKQTPDLVIPGTDTIVHVKFTSRQKVKFMILLGLAVVVYATVECKYQSFIMPFVLMQLDWTKSDGAFLISLLWAFFGLGRFTGVVLSPVLAPQRLLTLFICMLILASCGTWVGAYWHIDTLIWIAVPFAGFSVSIAFPTFLVWTHENALKMTGKISGFFMFVGSLGFLIDPLYVGTLMEFFSPMYFVYLAIGQSSLTLCLVLIMFRWVNSLKIRVGKVKNYE